MPNRKRTVAGPGLYSVGEVARATNIPIETLRIWERRYGSPEPVRLPSGHRRYTDDHVRRLRRVSEILARGKRPGEVLPLSDEELDRLLADAPLVSEQGRVVQGWLDLVLAGRLELLRAQLALATETTDPLACLEQRIAPLIVAIGRAWADGRLDVHGEHLATQVLDDALRAWRRRLLRDDPSAPRVLLATLPGEDHWLGLQMIAVLCAASGVEPRLLGPDTPVETIALAAVDQSVSAVAVSISLFSGGVSSDEALLELRQRLPPGIALVVGGQGALRGRRGLAGVTWLDGLTAAWDWLGSSLVCADG